MEVPLQEPQVSPEHQEPQVPPEPQGPQVPLVPQAPFVQGDMTNPGCGLS